MQTYFKHYTLTLLFVPFLLSPIKVQATDQTEGFNRQLEFDKALDFLTAFKNDSANLVLCNLLQQLNASQELDTPFGLRVRLREAEALEKMDRNEAAIEKLLTLIDISKTKQQWYVLAQAHIILARLYEKLGMNIQCLIHLRQANSSIKSHAVDAAYSRYAVRLSSYHRVFNNHRDSAIFYAKEAIRTAPQFNLQQQEADGHLLMGMLLARSSYKESAKHYRTAGKIFKSLQDYNGYGAIMINLSRLHQENNQLELALVYNDSAQIAAHIMITRDEDYAGLFWVNQRRGEIYKKQRQYDSAFHYLEQGYAKELNYTYQRSQAEAIEAKARYDDEKKAQKIREQEQLIAYEKSRQAWLIWLIVTIIGFTSVLAYYYFSLRKANKKTKEQAIALNKANQELAISLEQQIMLQGEVHHRVKNNLQVLIGLLELQSEEIKDPQALKNLEAMSNRIYSMAAIHEILYQKQGTEAIDLLEYTQNLCHHFSNFLDQQNKPIFQLNIEARPFNLETLMPLGIILNELITNSIKYAANLGQQLQIGISLIPQADGYCISYRDNGPGFPQGSLEEREGGLGTYLLKSMSRQLNGYLKSRNENGAVFEVFFKEKNPTLVT